MIRKLTLSFNPNAQMAADTFIESYPTKKFLIFNLHLLNSSFNYLYLNCNIEFVEK